MYCMKRKINVWKITSVVFIVLFGLLLLGKFARGPHFERSYNAPTQEQIDLVKNLVLTDLELRGIKGNIDLKVSENRRFSKNNIGASLSIDNKKISYLVNVDSGKLLMRSETEFFDEILLDKERPYKFNNMKGGLKNGK